MKKVCLLFLLGVNMVALAGCWMLSNQGHKSVLVHGHRGSRGTHPENTLPAFQEALEAGVDVFELDLQLSADGVPVLLHDAEISSAHCLGPKGKLIEKPIPVRSLTVEQIQSFDCGSVPNPRFPEQVRVPGTRIVTLQQFLQWQKAHAPTTQMNIETKMSADDPKWIADPREFVTAVVALLRRHAVIDKSILQSFDFRTLAVAREMEPKLRLSCLFETEQDFCEATAKEQAHIASPALQLVTQAQVTSCHQKGIEVVPWTANTAQEWDTLLAAKVDAIITDYPRKLIQHLKARSLGPQK